MTKNVTINVEITEEDCRKGTVDAVNCPLARALSRTLNQLVVVGTRDFLICGDTQCIPLPDDAIQFVDVFDSQGRAEPVTLSIPVPVNLPIL